MHPALAGPTFGLSSADPQERRAAALSLASHFVSSDTLTGLCPEAPDALWVLADAIVRRSELKTALHLFYKDLALLANLEDYEKDDFVDALQDPLPIYVALSISHAPHVHESRRMFRHMRRLLSSRKKTLTEWIRETDPSLRFAPNFLLRLNAYEALVPYLREFPSEAMAVPTMLFVEKRADVVDLGADQIQNIFDSLSQDPKAGQALHSFVEGCLVRIGTASPPLRRKIALLLHLNWKLLSAELLQEAEFVVGPPGDASSQARPAPLPYDRWPEREWRFSAHFADKKDLERWKRFFEAKGYRQEKSSEELVRLERQLPGGPRIVLLGYAYESLETGMLAGSELKRFQLGIAADMRDAAIKGVFVRAHAQFPRTPAFQQAKGSAKLWYDGSCRGAWDLAKLKPLCPDCVLVGNVGSGRGSVNDPMAWALLEGLGRKEEWSRIRDRIRKAVPGSFTRLIGPWSTPFSESLKQLPREETRTSSREARRSHAPEARKSNRLPP